MDEAVSCRLFLPDDAEDWWTSVPRGAYDVWLAWGGGVRLRLGELRTHPAMFRYAPELEANDGRPREEDIAAGAERFDRLFGKALTRAGWQLPDVDPDALWSIIRLRRQPEARIELILDTNAMVEGIGHWLAALFAERCDLVVTAVTLRELQDQHGGAKLGVPLCRMSRNDRQNKDVPSFEKEVLGRRQAYLAAMRFRESTGFERILWRELELEDASLMLSRSGLDKADRKTSEADTAMLREVRRAIRDRVRGLARFFVTGDVALSRRAATELPEGSLIAGRVRDLVRGRIYTPSVWWPAGADQGSSLAGHTPMRLVWELLAVADELELRSKEVPDRAWTFKAFASEMWPSDYLSPWIDCIGAPLGKPADGLGSESVIEAPIEPAPAIATQASIRRVRGTPVPVPIEPARTSAMQEPEATDARLFAEVSVPDVAPIDVNLRVSADTLLDALAALVSGAKVGPLTEFFMSEAGRHLAELLQGLGIAKLVRTRLEPLPGIERMAAAWRANERETVSRLLLPYRAYAEQVDPSLTGRPERPEKTVRIARKLAAYLGQGMQLQGDWLPGGANPTIAEVRAAILSELETRKALTMYDVFTQLFLRRLAVSPVRAMEAWDRMEELHVFDDIERRQGGGPPGEEHRQRIAKLSMAGWTVQDVPLDKFRGCRDLVLSPRSA
jgi:hypothetical protein